MSTQSLISKLKPGVFILVNEKKYEILQHIVWYQAKCGENYDKYVLGDESGNHEYRLFISGDIIGISTIFHHPFQEPMPKELNFEGKSYRLTQDEFCVVRLVEGQEFYKTGDAEIWWDYAPVDGHGEGLSLGRNWDTWEREDLRTQELSITDIQVQE
ncbi:MAG: hypothetical protein AAB909_01955 [Patescibacteria group bacterium]